jgi:hypothetical protein
MPLTKMAGRKQNPLFSGNGRFKIPYSKQLSIINQRNFIAYSKFSNTCVSLDSYDKKKFPTQDTVKEIETSATEIYQYLLQFKRGLMKKCEAKELFA